MLETGTTGWHAQKSVTCHCLQSYPSKRDQIAVVAQLNKVRNEAPSDGDPDDSGSSRRTYERDIQLYKM